MQCFVSGRRTGKTTQLIKLSHDTGIPIVTRNAAMANCIERQALRMGVAIPKPIVNRVSGWREPPVAKCESVLVDEAGGILEDMLGTRVVAVAINGDAVRIANPAMPDFEQMGLADLLREWRKASKQKGGRR